MKKNHESKEPCCACGYYAEKEVCYHHEYSQKSRPDLTWERFNRLPLCLEHHQERHNKTCSHMAEKYNGFMGFLLDNDWYYCNVQQKWRNPKAEKKVVWRGGF